MTMKNRVKLTLYRLLFLVASSALTGCSISYDNIGFDETKKITTVSAIDGGDQVKINDLTKAIIALDPETIDPVEAAWVAREGVLYPKHLANQYRLMWPPNYQNVLVNTGRREKGLCYEWARDMSSHIASRSYKSLTLQRAVANQGGNYEHNVLTVAAKGKGVEDAIILDPWRHASLLYWVRTKDDPNYQWVKYYPRKYYVNDENQKVFISNKNNPANSTN